MLPLRFSRCVPGFCTRNTWWQHVKNADPQKPRRFRLCGSRPAPAFSQAPQTTLTSVKTCFFLSGAWEDEWMKNWTKWEAILREHLWEPNIYGRNGEQNQLGNEWWEVNPERENCGNQIRVRRRDDLPLSKHATLFSQLCNYTCCCFCLEFSSSLGKPFLKAQSKVPSSWKPF